MYCLCIYYNDSMLFFQGDDGIWDMVTDPNSHDDDDWIRALTDTPNLCRWVDEGDMSYAFLTYDQANSI